VSDPQFALECVRAGAVDVFNIALCGCGGIYRALQVAAVARAAEVPCLLGSTLELWPGTAAQAHFGAAISSLGFPSDLVGPLMYQTDVVRRPWSYSGGALAVPRSPGLGVELDYGLLGDPI
jgi:muconate cycloisomerase